MIQHRNAGSQGRRVLVLGAGFIGAAVTRRLLAEDYDVTVLSRSAPGLRPEDGADLVLGDAGEMGTLSPFIAETDHVVYALGSSSPAESELDPAIDVMAVLPPIIRLLELLRLRPSVSLVFLSSGGAVYGNAAADRLAESTPPAPISSYGLLKLTCEKYVEMYSQRFDLNARILRVSNAYGPGQSSSGGQGVVAHLMRSALTGASIPLYAPDETVRDFIYIDDVAAAVAGLLGRTDGPMIVNVGSGIGHTVRTVVQTIEAISGGTIAAQQHRARRFDVLRNVLECTVLTSLIDFQATSLNEGLARTWKSTVDSLGRERLETTAKRAPMTAR